MADLYCEICDQCHDLTAGEIERLVYQLVAEAKALEDAPVAEGRDAEWRCLEALLNVSLESGLREYVDQMVQARREFTAQYRSRWRHG